MNLLIAFGLLIMLIIYIGKKDRSVKEELAARKAEPETLDWIDELELLDAATDDFI